MINIDYQSIYDVIADTLPENWEKVFLYCLRWSASSEVKYFVKSQDGIIKDCYDLGVPDDVLLNKTIELMCLINKGDHQWRSLTVIIEADGSFDAKADYTSDIDDTSIYLNSWREQYLK